MNVKFAPHQIELCSGFGREEELAGDAITVIIAWIAGGLDRMLRTLIPVLALAACQYVAALNLVPTPPKQPPKFNKGSSSATSRVMGATSMMHSRQKSPLQAYTISEPVNKKNDWLSQMPKWEDFFLPKSAGHGEKRECIFYVRPS